ncbi:hypothetical protein KR018_003529 [Drosophila ironensis]|nr:hypothetical protein KR018_003529 [Drosophila ironensis]
MDKISRCGEWVKCGQLGQGGFGEVLHWRHRTSGLEIATKHVRDLNSLSADQQIKLSERWHKEFQWTREFQAVDNIVAGVVLKDAEFLAFLNSRHIAQLPVIVLEYCNGGDVRKRLQSPENINGLVEFEVREVLGAMRRALHFLHSQCLVCHRDLKPENIVIQRGANGRKVYKLTDFGLAREAPERTMQQSVVGTRHYFAPEVVETGEYNMAVDHWSLGVIGYELATGELPFIPHQSPRNILVNIIHKPVECIAITEDPNDPNRFVNHCNLPQQHRLTGPFARELTNWLKIALDRDYKRRGRMAADEVQQPIVFTELDRLLQVKVLTIFAMNSCKRLEYAVTEDMTMDDLLNKIEHDTKIDKRIVYSVLPTSHPHKKITKETTPLDLYVEAWSDTSKEARTPPVMLYVFDGTAKCPYGVPEPVVSDLIRTCTPSKFKSRLRWIQKALFRDVYYMLSNEQTMLETFLSGMFEHAVALEDDIISYPYIDSLSYQINITAYAFNQMKLLREAVKQELLNVQLSDGAEWDRLSSCFAGTKGGAESILGFFNSALRQSKEKVKNVKDLLVLYSEKDEFRVNSFKKKCLANGGGISLEEFRDYVKDFAQRRAKFFKKESVVLSEPRSIDTLHSFFNQNTETFQLVLHKLSGIQKDIFQMHKNMLKSTSVASSVNEVSDAMNSLSMSSGGPCSIPYDASCIDLINKSDLIMNM